MKFNNIMKYVYSEVKENLNIFVLLLLTWIILFESFNVFVLLSGIVSAVIVITFTDLFLLQGSYDSEYLNNIWVMIRYLAYLLYEIFVAGFGVIPNIISGKSDASYVSCQTKLTDDFLIDILANSVTLTPGTVTVEKEGSTLRILALDIPQAGEDPRLVLPLKLEALLLEYEAKRGLKK